MQIHEITLRRRKIDEALGGLGSFMSGLTGGMSDKYMDKTPGAGKEQNKSTKWQERYTALQKDPTVSSYVKSIAASWVKNPQAAGEPTQGLATSATLQKTVPSLVTAAKKTNNNLTSTQIGQILSQAAPTIWNNTQDKSSAIQQLTTELVKQGVTVDKRDAPVAKTSQRQNPLTTYGKVPSARVPAAPGQMPADVASSAQGRKMRQLYGKPRSGIQGMKSDLEEAATIGPAADQYRTAFTKWADGQFATRVQETGTTVTMDAVRKAFPDLTTELKSALDKVVATKGTPQQAPAVEEYAKLAVAGVQAVAQMQKNKVSTVDQQKNKQISNTEGSIKQSLTQAGVDPSRLSQVGGQQSVRPTGNPAADSLLKLSGFKI
jgi:hypothetical protein